MRFECNSKDSLATRSGGIFLFEQSRRTRRWIPFDGFLGIYLESVEEFERAFAEHGAEISADVINYTNIRPAIEMQEIL